MKTTIKLTLILIFLGTLSTNAQQIKAYFNYYEFYSPVSGPYIETHVAIEGQSLQWISNADGKLSAAVEMTIIFKLDSQVIAYTKDIIHSPKINDTSETERTFMHSNRFPLKAGNYTVNFKLDDLNDTSKAFFTTTELVKNNVEDSVAISSIEVFSSYEKSAVESINNKGGYLFSPNIYSFLPATDSVLNFYTEIYNTDKKLGIDELFLVKYYLINNESKQALNQYTKFKKLSAKQVQAVMSSFNISDLPSGNFTLAIEVRSQKNQLLAQADYYFQRQNKFVKMDINDLTSVNIASTFAELITGKDTLINIIKSLYPISTESEKAFSNQLVKGDDIYVMQQYLFTFWENRNITDPFTSFKNYMEKVKEADRAYATRVAPGYDTDRGRVFLKYGEPNSIAREYNDPAAYPYEIWHYYQTNGQRNVRFIFYNNDLSTNLFYLIHSTAIGEPNNYQWRLLIRGRDKGWRSIDDSGDDQDDWGSNYNRYYETPR